MICGVGTGLGFGRSRGLPDGALVLCGFEDLPPAGAAAASWPNRATASRPLAQAAPARQGVVIDSGTGRPALSFPDSARGMLTSALVIPSPATVMHVVRVTAHTAVYGYLWSGDSAGGAAKMACYEDTTTDTKLYSGATLTYAGNVANGAWAVVTGVYNGAASYLLENDIVRAGPGNAGGAAGNAVMIGMVRAAYTNGTASDWMYTAWWPRVLNADELTQGYRWLKTRCGL